MLLSLEWLHEFVPYDGTLQELGDCLTMLGFELEDLLFPYDTLKNVVIGHVIACKKHPEADNLSICDVDIGAQETLSIICGASNISLNQKVPVACINTTLPNGLTIKKTKIRGIESFGMICSEEELGFGKGAPGIMVLPEHTHIGIPFTDAVPLDKEILKVSVTPNRGDCLSVLGLAREIAVAFHLPLTHPKTVIVQNPTTEASKNWTIHIDPNSNCSLYQLCSIRNVSVSFSPLHIRQRLHAVDIQPISNIVDITNYILMELGQPLHAYDQDTLIGKNIHIKLAEEKKSIHTLDGKHYDLKPSDIIICDETKPIALAGIMGCKQTEVTEQTKNILLESAIFQPKTIRKTTRNLNITSESAYRFERGVDHGNAGYALNQAIQHILSIAGGKVTTDICSYEPKPYKQPNIQLSLDKATSLLGISIPDTFYFDTLTHLGCDVTLVKNTTTPTYDVKVPTWRRDLTQQVDLIEEIIRFKGLDTIHEQLPMICHSLDEFNTVDSLYSFSAKVRSWAANIGLNETKHYSFISSKELDVYNMPSTNKLIITNPLTEEQDILRTSVIPSLLHSIRYNIAHGNTGIRIFEVANTFTFDASSETTAAEYMHLGIAMHGELFDTGWPQPRVDVTYLDILGIVEHLIHFLGLKNLSTVKTDHYAFLNPGILLNIHGHTVGYIGHITKKIATTCHTHKDIWVAELYIEMLKQLYQARDISIQSPPIYPASYRDITIITKIGLSISSIQQYLEELSIDFLEHIVLLDLFEPKDTDERHSTFRLYFRHPKRTLKDKDVDIEYQKIVSALTNNFSIRISQ